MAAKYKVLHQDDSHFLMQHPSGNHFKVAKNALDHVTRNEIQKMADGGDVVADADVPLDESAQPEAPQSVSNWDALKRGFGAVPGAIVEGVKTAYSPIAKADAAMQKVYGTPGYSDAVPQAQPSDTPAIDSAKSEDASEKPGLGVDTSLPAPSMPNIPQTPEQRQPKSDSSIQNPDGLYDFQRQQMQGVQEKQKAEAALGQGQAKVYGELAGKLQAADDAFQKSHAQYQAQNERLMAEIADPASKINPNHYWQNKSTAGKVTSLIGMLLGGIGAGLSGGENIVIKQINKEIDNDVDAQKSNLANKNSLFSKNLELTHDMESATALTKSNLLAVATALTGKVAGQNAGPMAQAASDQLQGQLKGQFMQQNFELAKRQALSRFMGGGAGGDAALPLLFSGDIKPEQFVTLPNGQMRIASSPKDAEDLKKSQVALQEINSQIQNMKAFRQQHGATIPYTTADDQGHRLKENMVLSFGKLADLQRFTPEEAKRYEQLISHPGRANGAKFEQNIQDLEGLVRDKSNAIYTNHLMGYKPVNPAR